VLSKFDDTGEFIGGLKAFLGNLEEIALALKNIGIAIFGYSTHA